MDRTELAALISTRLSAEKNWLQATYQASEPMIGHFFIDDLLPDDIARRIHAAFPRGGQMTLKRSLREFKFIAAQMDRYDPILEEAIFAFQAPEVVALIKDICGLKSVYPDEHLYAGGISAMGKGHFLNPHLDNSHDKDRQRWRVLNLLYYVTPDWPANVGGNLELWPDGVDKPQTTIFSVFNRLAVMATHNKSWHSVSPISHNAVRCCVSNYYFADEPLKANDDFHVTSFRGRPGQKLVDGALKLDAAARMAIRKAFPKGAVNAKHVYKKD